MTPEHPDPLSPLAHQEWAANIARDVATSYGFPPHSDSTSELESVAISEVCELLIHKFDRTRAKAGDVEGCFRGFANRPVRTACVRAADELRGGGTVKQSVQPENRRTVSALGDAAPAVANHPPTSPASDPCTRIRINDTLYAVPFERLLRQIAGQELADFESDIETHGILNPLTVCTLPDLGAAIIDGGTRGRIAAAKGLRVPLVDLGLVTWEWARDRALALNVLRRQLTAEEMKQQQLARRGRIVAAREAGASLRMIAREEGIKHVETVRRELKAAGYEPELLNGVTVATPDAEPAPIVAFPHVKPSPSSAALAASCTRALTLAFKKFELLLKCERDKIIRLASECDIPFEDIRPGHEDWPALTTLTTMSGLLARI